MSGKRTRSWADLHCNHRGSHRNRSHRSEGGVDLSQRGERGRRGGKTEIATATVLSINLQPSHPPPELHRGGEIIRPHHFFGAPKNLRRLSRQHRQEESDDNPT
jgi:hypothetical protein